MTDPHDLDVRTVYTSESPRPPSPPPSTAARVRVRLVGLLSLVVAMGWIYVTWFPVDRFLVRGMVKVALAQPPEIDWSFLWSDPPGSLPHKSGNEDPTPPGILAPPHPPETAPLSEPPCREHPLTRPATPTPPTRQTAEPVVPATTADLDFNAVMKRLGCTMYAWLTSSTVVAAWLALCGGAGLGGLFLGERKWNTGNLFLIALAVILVVAGGVFAVQQALGLWTYDLPKPPPSAEIGFALAVLLCGAAACTFIPRPAATELAILVFGALVGLIAYTWSEYERVYPAGVPRVLVMLVFLGAAMVGVRLTRKANALQMIAVVLVLISAGFTPAAMAYARGHGALEELAPTTATYVKAFLLQSSYAWVVLALRLGLR